MENNYGVIFKNWMTIRKRVHEFTPKLIINIYLNLYFLSVHIIRIHIHIEPA